MMNTTRLSHVTRKTSPKALLAFLLIALPFSGCECDPELAELPEPEIEVQNAAGDSHVDADPWLKIAFGDVDTGVSSTQTLTIKNIKTGTLEIGRICLVAVTTKDAAVAEGAPCLQSAATPYAFGPLSSTELRADETTTFDITFTPRDGGPVNLFVRIESNADDEPVVAVEITGRGTAGRLCTDDFVLEFGDVFIGDEKTLSATLTNCGVRPVTVDSFLMLQNPDDAFTVLIGGVEVVAPLTAIDEGQTVVLDVTFKPTQVRLYRDNLAGLAQLTTAEPFLAEYTLMFQGNGVTPPVCRVNVVPSTLNFGAVASNEFVDQNVIVQSVGDCACQITEITPPNPGDVGFALGAAPATPIWLKGSAGCASDPVEAQGAPQTLQIPIRYTAPDRATPQTDNATMTVTTTDEMNSTRTVNLTANGGGTPFCQLEVTPEGATGLDIIQAQNRHGLASFGRVSVHGKKRIPISLTNIGNSNCTVSSVQWDFATNTLANEFSLENEDGSVVNVGALASFDIGANVTRTFFAVFAPTTVIVPDNVLFPDFNFGSYSGAIQEGAISGTIEGYCNFNDTSCNGVKFVTSDLLTPPTGTIHPQGEFSIGFSATPVEPAIDVIPGDIDFGLVTVGCGSPERCLTVYNTGSGDLVIDEPYTQPVTNPETFAITAVQNPTGTWPHSISPGSSMGICVRYYANALGEVNGDIVIPTVEGGQEAPPVTIPLRGEGTYETETTDFFDQFTDPKVDVLWVVDDSGSMSPFQTQLANNFDDFFTSSNVDDADYHIAVTTTLTTDGNCIDPFGVQSCPIHEKCGYYTSCSGNDRYLTPASTNPDNQFQCNVQVSNSGAINPSRPASDSAEGALQAARQFFSSPNIDDPAINGGFLRDDAKLHVIMVSDEPDQSEGPVDLYIDFFRNLKGFHNEGLVAVSAIAVGNSGCTMSDGTQLSGDPRYQAVVDAMNGRFQSICDADWTTMMSNLGLDSLGLQIEFFLTRAADAASLDVCVRLTGPSDPTCTPIAQTSEGAASGYFFDPQSNSIVFNAASVPPRGARIEVHYEAYCY